METEKLFNLPKYTKAELEQIQLFWKELAKIMKENQNKDKEPFTFEDMKNLLTKIRQSDGN